MKTNFKSSVLGSLVAAGIIAGTGAAFAAVSLGDTLGANEEEIRASLTEMGYEVLEIEVEGGEIEAEVLINGQEMELVVDTATGAVVEMELEDGDDEDDDEDGDDEDDKEAGKDDN